MSTVNKHTIHPNLYIGGDVKLYIRHCYRFVRQQVFALLLIRQETHNFKLLYVYVTITMFCFPVVFYSTFSVLVYAPNVLLYTPQWLSFRFVYAIFKDVLFLNLLLSSDPILFLGSDIWRIGVFTISMLENEKITTWKQPCGVGRI